MTDDLLVIPVDTISDDLDDVPLVATNDVYFAVEKTYRAHEALLCIATLATNIAANVVSPANDFANLWPSKISFRTGGLITGVLATLMMPWT